jgi:hypothetical protein
VSSQPRSGAVHHPIFARLYARLSPGMEPGVVDRRRALLAGLSGRMIEVGAGNGLNFPHDPPAVAEVRRVIRPGGQLRFLEHVLAEEPRLARVQRMVDPVWPLLGAGCHASRDTLAAIRAAGFEVERVDRFRFRAAKLGPPTSWHVIGAARRPAPDAPPAAGPGAAVSLVTRRIS